MDAMETADALITKLVEAEDAGAGVFDALRDAIAVCASDIEFEDAFFSVVNADNEQSRRCLFANWVLTSLWNDRGYAAAVARAERKKEA